MHVIDAVTVCEALPKGVSLLQEAGHIEDSRAGPVLVAPWPVATVYHQPLERVLLNPIRDANPFFHLMESMWMLVGRDDATFLDTYVQDFSARFSEDGVQHGAYGKRWRNHFCFDGNYPIDQLDVLVDQLKADPASRQAVLTMYDPMADMIGIGHPRYKDIPCNTQVFFRIKDHRLHQTVMCRSNDIIWGCYGANAVHFAFLLEYMAARIGVGVGTYTQVSNNFHAYVEPLTKLMERADDLVENLYTRCHGLPAVLMDDPSTFDQELDRVLRGDDRTMRNRFLSGTVATAMAAMRVYRIGDRKGALTVAGGIDASDWRQACCEWIERRIK